MKDEITGEDWNDFWHGQSIEEQEKSIEESIIALFRSFPGRFQHCD